MGSQPLVLQDLGRGVQRLDGAWQFHLGDDLAFERIAELLGTSPDGPQIATAAQHFGQEDDITVLTLTFVASEAVAAQASAEM